MQVAFRLVAVTTLLFATFSLTVSGGPVTFFSTGFSLPEDIVAVPNGFGALGGSYLVTDPTANFVSNGVVYSIPSGGGSPVQFKNLDVVQPIGSVFLPSSYGSLGGEFLAAGRDANAGNGDAVALNSSGQVTPVVSNIGTFQFADVAIAPAGFGLIGGEAVLVHEDGVIYALSTSLGLSLVPGGASLPISPFGITFAPNGFGNVGGDMLVSSSSADGSIYAISPGGTLSLFTKIPLGAGQFGLRQMAFIPAGFGTYSGDLLVSVSGSNAGGGIAGAVEVVNPAGQVVAYLAVGTVGMPYDPRGIYFSDSSHVLISDADPGVLFAPASAFTAGSPVPEPSTALLALAALPLLRKQWRRFAC